ncbi:ABC transporter ATP-binding protein [Corallincola platygyrae]|uniref:ABC transporter ATP-binding protein n=1 Tax=Corallincola platygyrae TaxID=1193278 RepID=A0ABW4XHP5_9GAMM
MLSVENVGKSYGGHAASGNPSDTEVLKGVNLTIERGEMLALMGASGSGKSTLLHLIGGLDQQFSGEIRFEGLSLGNASDEALCDYRRRQLGFVFQQFNLLPTLSVQDNLLFPRRVLGLSEQSDHTEHLIERLGLAELLHRWPDQLSGGQQQRVAIARALSHQPPLILADEPTGNLDDELSHQVMALLTELCRSANSALVMVTHSREMASYLDKTQLLHNRQLHNHRLEASQPEVQV